MLDLNSFNQEEKEVAIFNNGNAGKVENVVVKVTKKTAEDSENSPDYKINYTDETGTINDGIYYPSDDDRNPGFRITRLLNVLNSLDPSAKDKPLPKVENYSKAVDAIMKMINVASKSGKVNVFANYGTNSKPSDYLRVRTINFVEPVGKEKSRLTASVGGDYGDVMSRPTPTSDVEIENSFADDGIEDDGFEF